MTVQRCTVRGVSCLPWGGGGTPCSVLSRGGDAPCTLVLLIELNKNSSRKMSEIVFNSKRRKLSVKYFRNVLLLCGPSELILRNCETKSAVDGLTATTSGLRL